MVIATTVTYLIREPWVFPIILVLGGLVSVILSKERNIWNRVKLNPPWIYIILFVFFAVGSLILNIALNHYLINVFESFYRYGYLVFGGGQVVIPVMHNELVEVQSLMTNTEFLTGYGLVQGLPGPMFSFSAFAGGLAARGYGSFNQVLGSLLGALGIFLPGLLLIYFVYPIWENLKKIKGIKISLKGVNAIAGGMIASSALILIEKSGITPVNLLVTFITALLLFKTRIPAPFIVLFCIILGFIF
jgi:chromate transporter